MKIDKGIPIPEKHSCRAVSKAAILRKMKPGDSLFFSSKEEQLLKNFRACASQLERRGQLPDNIAFAQRKVKGGWRIWKIRKELK